MKRILQNLLIASASSAVALGSACGGGSDEDGGSRGVSGSDSRGGSTGQGGSSASGGRGGTPTITGGSSNGARGGTESGGEGGGCGKTDLAAEPPPVNVLLVVDKSSSMSGTPEGFDEPKWSALGSALGAALGEARDRVAFGLDFYPFGDDRDPMASVETCQMPANADILVPIGPGADTVPLIEDALADYQPAGGTPTAAALARALEYFRDGDGAALEGERYVLLATDGGPNCNADLDCDAETCTLNMDGFDCGGNCCASTIPGGPESCLDDAETAAQVAALAGEGVRTFVVGIPGTEAYGDTLDALAEEGLVPNPDAPPSYYRVESSGGTAGLVEVLTRITRGVIRSCRLQLDSTPDDIGLLNVEIDGEEIPQPGDDGWEVDGDTDPPTIVLKGETCARMEREGADRVTITYGCRTRTEPH